MNTKPANHTTELHPEEHPDWYHDIPVMEILILGSYPPHQKRWNYSFYYPNKQNHFWKILAALDNNYNLKHYTGEEAVAERKQLMERLKTGIQNMGKTILRKGSSAQDTDITITSYQDVMAVIRQHPELKLIILPGFSAASSTFKTFCDYFSTQDVRFTAPKKPSHGLSFELHVAGRVITCVICTSTSPATAERLSDKTEKFRAIYNLLEK